MSSQRGRQPALFLVRVLPVIDPATSFLGLGVDRLDDVRRLQRLAQHTEQRPADAGSASPRSPSSRLATADSLISLSS